MLKIPYTHLGFHITLDTYGSAQFRIADMTHLWMSHLDSIFDPPDWNPSKPRPGSVAPQHALAGFLSAIEFVPWRNRNGIYEKIANDLNEAMGHVVEVFSAISDKDVDGVWPQLQSREPWHWNFNVCGHRNEITPITAATLNIVPIFSFNEANVGTAFPNDIRVFRGTKRVMKFTTKSKPANMAPDHVAPA